MVKDIRGKYAEIGNKQEALIHRYQTMKYQVHKINLIKKYFKK